MADKYTTLQLSTPCRLSEASDWFEEVKAIMGEDGLAAAEVSVIEHTDGHWRITVHLGEST
jgi:hypothetical protein